MISQQEVDLTENMDEMSDNGKTVRVLLNGVQVKIEPKRGFDRSVSIFAWKNMTYYKKYQNL